MTASERNLGRDGAMRAPASIDDSIVRQIDSMCRAAIEGRCAVRALAAWAKRFGLTEADFQLLWRLRFAPGDGLDQTALADELCLSQSQISATVERMRASGWVRQGMLPGDRRRHLWLLSASGQDLIDKMLGAAALLRCESATANACDENRRQEREAAA